MRRAVWIFFASIFLPSLGLAWLAIHSVRDQQVVLEHQQAIICQNITDALAKSVQNQMDQARSDFVTATQQLLAANSSPQSLAENFDRSLRQAWPLAEIGFAVNLDGEIFSPKPFDSPEARTFRNENDSFLSNRENVEVYTSNSSVVTQNTALNQNTLLTQNAASQLALKLPNALTNAIVDKAKNVTQTTADLKQEQQSLDTLEITEKDAQMKHIHADADTGIATSRGKTTAATPPLSGATSVETTSEAALESAPSAAPAMPAPAPDQSISAKGTMEIQKAAISKAAAAEAAQAPVPAATATLSPSTAPTGGETDAISVPAPMSTSTVISSTTVNAAPIATAEDSMVNSNAASTSNAVLNNSAVANNNSTDYSANSMPQIFAKIQRQVIPQQILARDNAALSNTMPEESDFRRVIGTETSGELARFLEDKMRLMVWSHATADAPIVFGAQLDLEKVIDALKSSLQIPELRQDSFSRSSDGDVCVAILDDTGHPVALSRPGFAGDWKHPFVATEIGEVLPHWEAALYLVDPKQISRAAQTLQVTFALIVMLLVTAILSGGSIIARDVRRQMRLAQQKTDFVSNVSHELKTPLTSIRMFADLLAEKRVPDEERQATYLRIIAAEASRLTRLINNVLDFARLEKDAPHGEHGDCDLVDAVRDVAETCGPHLEAAGISFQCEVEAETLPIRGDRDELAQIILNLISNAEKYGGNDILVRVRRQEISTGALGCVDVLDRGTGIPARQVKTVFEPFHRLEDSLSSGIPGSGLGLTLARRMARAHGGDVTYSARAGGGSCFTLAVPLAKKN